MSKMYIYISDAESWLASANTDPDGEPFDHSFRNAYRQHLIQVTVSESMEDHGWLLVGELDVPEINPSDDVVRKAALDKIEKQEKKQVAENEVAMQRFDERRQKLLAITHQADDGIDGLVI